jgi:ABC-type sugar transport system substrate-binding protein
MKRDNNMRHVMTSLVVLFLAAFTGCNGSTSSNTKQPDASVKLEKPKKVAVIISTLNNPWFVVLGETARDRAVELGYEANLFDSQNDTAKEAAHFDNVIAAGYSAILFNPTDADGSVASVKRAKSAGIPVFCIDREINSTDAATAQLLSDNFAGCVELGKYFVEVLGENGKYVELLGLVGDNNTWNRSKGFHSVVDRYEGLKMVAQQSADFDRNKALEVLESVLQSHSDIDAVFCGNDAMAMGAYQALLAAGKADTVKVFGYDGSEDVVKSISEKKIAATVMQYPKVMAKTSAEFAHEYLANNKRDFDQKIPVNVDLVTQKNISDFKGYGKKE